MTTLREAATQALESLEDFGMKYYENTGEVLHRDVYESLKSALAEEALQRLTDVSQEIEAALTEPVQEAEELKDPAEYDDFAAAIRHNERVTTRRYDSVGPVALETVYETIIHWDEGGGKRSRRELARRIVDLYSAPPQRPAEPTEPVAWIQPDHLQKARVAPFLCRVEPTQRCSDFVALYTAPSKRKPLTEEKIEKLLIESAGMTVQFSDVDLRLARAIERAHGIGGQP